MDGHQLRRIFKVIKYLPDGSHLGMAEIDGRFRQQQMLRTRQRKQVLRLRGSACRRLVDNRMESGRKGRPGPEGVPAVDSRDIDELTLEPSQSLRIIVVPDDRDLAGLPGIVPHLSLVLGNGHFVKAGLVDDGQDPCLDQIGIAQE